MKKEYTAPQVEQAEWVSLTHLCDVSTKGGYSPVSGMITE